MAMVSAGDLADFALGGYRTRESLVEMWGWVQSFVVERDLPNPDLQHLDRITTGRKGPKNCCLQSLWEPWWGVQSMTSTDNAWYFSRCCLKRKDVWACRSKKTIGGLGIMLSSQKPDSAIAGERFETLELPVKSLCTQTLLLQCYKGFLLRKSQTLRVFSRTRTKDFEVSVYYSMQEP